MKTRTDTLLWLVPLCLFSGDALAWGLSTHIYFSQLLIWAVPLADSRFREAARRFPRLVMAGACLPDLSLVGGAPFARSHCWNTLAGLLDSAVTAEEQAITLGYASHLLADVVAHNHFVPAHEAMWLDQTMLTHVTAEWAMDSHISRQLFAGAGVLLESEREILGAFVGARFGCSQAHAERALQRLARADRLLRGSGLPHGLYRVFRLVDRNLTAHFDYYAGQTAARLGQINQLLAGEKPTWAADPQWSDEAWKVLQNLSLAHLIERLPLPHSYFHHHPNEALAMLAPISAPASTSLG
ncbi:MAG: zinc dependent phospholipase C family protein [Sulfuricella sp.]|nr:zinc dependent phospholipase C family protein [Sulfuricella sp.]